MTDQQIDALIRLLSATGKTIDEIAEMGKRVVRKTTYGNIDFEHWMDEQPQKVTARGECAYCSTEWWGAPDMKCPNCFPNP